MSLILVGVVLLLGFVVAETNDTVIVNETLEVNESDIPNDTVVVAEAVDVDDIVIDSDILDGYDSSPEDDPAGLGEPEVVEEKDSSFDVASSYISSVIDKINAIHHNLFIVVVDVFFVLLMLLYFIFYGKKSSSAYFARASSLHGKAQRAHVNGDYAKAKKLYSKSYSLREEGERKADSELC
jgi:hypothetical protein